MGSNPKEETGAASGKSVLIVDDDRIIREQLEKELKRNFFEPVLAEDGSSALSILEKQPVNIVLLDVKLPDTDGIKLLKKVKKLQPNCEVIVITGFGSQQVAIQSLRYGAIDYVEKPINTDELSTALGRASEKYFEKHALAFQNTLLLIDDDEQTIDYLKKFLKKEDFRVFSATNGRKGLDIIETHKIDVVITDIEMDDMDGIEILTKTKERYDDIEVIMITGHEEYAVKSLRAGAFDYISKPVNLEGLLFSITRAIERNKLKRNRLYRNRELMISTEIMSKLNIELERRIEVRTKELNEVQSQLFQTSKLAILGEITAGLAHEMNQPLSGISLISKQFRKLKAKDKLTDEELNAGLDDIDYSIKRMSKVIQHVRTFSRQDKMEFMSVDINSTINEGLNLLAEQLRLHGITIVKNFDEKLPQITGEPYQIEQVFINIISNARDALDIREEESDGGSSSFDKTITVSTKWDGKNEQVEISFKDEGIGMTDQELEKIFEPFFTTKEVGKAVGLGMSISYGIIESHKGTIDIESEKGKGTTVRVILPKEGDYDDE